MYGSRGFTLVETLIASLILASGLAAVAAMFSYSIRVNLINRQRTVAMTLLHDKMEEMKSTPLTAADWEAGEYSEEVRHGSTSFHRRWIISGNTIRNLTVAVSIGQRELARANTSVSPLF